MFEAHGSYDLVLRGRILEVNVKGAWNLESALDYAKSVDKFITSLSGQPWAMVSIIDDFELFTPDCKPVIQKLSRNAYRNGLVREAMVNFEYGIKIQAFQPTVKGFPTFKRGFFKTKPEAQVWLKEQGFEVLE